MQRKKKDKLIWWVKCPHCGLELHIADLGWEVVEKGQKVFVSCPDCGAHIEKVVGKDLGKLVKPKRKGVSVKRKTKRKRRKLLGVSKDSDFIRFVYEIDENRVLVRSFLSVKGRKFKILEKIYKKEEVKVFLSNLTKN